MYSSRLELLRKLIPAEEAVQCVPTAGDQTIPIGTPMIVQIKPFVPTNKPKWKTDIKLQGRDSKPIAANELNVKASITGSDKVTAKDLLEMDSHEAHTILRANSPSLRALCAINLYGSMHYVTYSISPRNISMLKSKPLIYDDGLVIEGLDLNSILEDNGLFDAKTAKELLSSHRFVDVVMHNVTRGIAPNSVGAINRLMSSFSSLYEHSIAMGFGELSNIRVIVDTINISLYNLMDIIPVFDMKRTDGLLLEIHLLSSACTHSDVLRTGRLGLLVRVLYSKHRDGVFSIDGERVVYSSVLKKVTVEGMMCDVLMDCTPNKLDMKKAEEGN